MKLVHVIVRNEDANNVIEALVENGFYVTRLASTGGFLRMGNTVFISGIEDDQVERFTKVIHAHTEIHIHPPSSSIKEETRVSRAVVFVQDMEQLLKL
jgi:uncharacterized protein YaaQ